MKQITTTKRVKFWTRVSREKYDEWKLVEGEDRSGVPLETWKAFNKSFWQWKQKGLLRPLDEMDAYQFTVGELVRTCEKMEVVTAAPATYLVSAARRSLMKYRDRQVRPARADQCAIADISLDVRAYVEALPGTHSFDRVNSMRLASACVEATLARLDDETVRGLRAWLRADGVWSDAAKLYGCSRPWYYEMFKWRWAPAFRKACVWSW